MTYHICCMLYAVRCIMHNVRCMMQDVRCTMYDEHCMVHARFCVTYRVWRMLYAVCRTWCVITYYNYHIRPIHIHIFLRQCAYLCLHPSTMINLYVSVRNAHIRLMHICIPLSPYTYTCFVPFRQAKIVSALYGWPTDLSARRVRLRRDLISRGSPAHREFSRKCELEGHVVGRLSGKIGW
jgi:hypothetical protein